MTQVGEVGVALGSITSQDYHEHSDRALCLMARAGDRVQLYELGNEPELACGYVGNWATAGSRAAELWLRLAPDVRKRGRANGIEPTSYLLLGERQQPVFAGPQFGYQR